MKFSVALCTYNGAAYLPSQLQSLATQERLPDELIACDDGSMDQTQDILSRFADGAPFPVRLRANPVTLGVTQNFAQAARLCRGNIIAFCDQDDVWYPHKLRRLEQVFQDAPQTGMIFTDADLVDAQGTLLPGSLWARSSFSARRQQCVRRGNAFPLLLSRNYVTGATMAFQEQWRELVLPIPEQMAVLHDAWIALLISAVAPVVALPESTIQYRQHSEQQTHLGRQNQPMLRPVSHFQSHLLQTRLLRDRLRLSHQFATRLDANQLLADLAARIEHLERRTALPAPLIERVATILEELFRRRYHRYSHGLHSAASDLFRRGST